MTRDAAFKRRVRARMARTGESYSSARAHLDSAGAARPGADRTGQVLHLTNGDVTVGLLREAGLAEPILPWRDVLHDGPVPGGLTDAELRSVRAEFIAGSGWGSLTAVRDSFDARDEMLAAHSDARLVLWFEADLYDQLQIIQVLDQLRRRGAEPARISLVSAGEFPGIAHFGGLGQLRPDDLLRLRTDEVVLTTDALDLAARAWAAFTAADPSGLAGVAGSSSPVLRYVAEAFGRLMQEYPARSDGLSLTQRRILLSVEDGANTPSEAFAEVGRRERRPYLGDTSCFAIIEGLASARRPLLTWLDDAPLPSRGLRLTAAGREVLAGHSDHVAEGGIDRWIGGVHLTGSRPPWRYDERRERLVAA
ncbi:hypothetical protein [Actinopolymorpha pittospori]|uniref:DUF1835 domain-containing protein n=1 Tax=Actinopolymorpha pittospori TaxID=648752 RepID=A0A927RDN7_9ACTN|nr:hypothetical protein [Actinopolymorpha pittospori]MBE1611254.1 hypothetical protein [Actinopolymorpha pittospori]